MHGQCPRLYGEVTEDTKEAIIIMGNDQQKGKSFPRERNPEAQTNILFD